MSEQVGARRQRLRTPRAAAFAGIVFSVLLITSLVLLQLAVSHGASAPGSVLASNGRSVSLGLNLVPFAGIAFLWFVGVLRDRIGDLEDRFFATVFLGSGLLFLAMLFGSAAVAGGMIAAINTQGGSPSEPEVYAVNRAAAYTYMNIYAIKMAGVFMISTATILLRTEVMPRWISLLGYAVAALLLLSIGFISWASLLFPLWILLLSAYILIDNLRRPGRLAGRVKGPRSEVEGHRHS